jgi:cytoskeleton protein RodZ
MESQDNMEQQQGASPSGAASGVAVGATLREAREAMGLSVEEVAGRLKFAPRQIEALEAGDFAQLPEMAFIRGFVRSYARLVQMDEKPLLAALPGAPAATAIQVRAGGEVPRQGAESRKQNLFWIGGALLVVVVGIIAWKYDTGEHAPRSAQRATTEASSSAGGEAGSQPGQPAVPEQTAQAGQAATAGVGQPAATAQPSGSGQPAAATPAPVTPQNSTMSRNSMMSQNSVTPHSPAPAETVHPPKPPRVHREPAAGASGVGAPSTMAPAKKGAAQGPSRTVRLEFAEDSWVEITDGNGKTLLSMLGKAGTSRSAAGPAPLTVVVGNAKGVKLFYKGQPVELKPAAGSEVVRMKLE